MLNEKEIREIREGVRQGLPGPILLAWVERLLEDHEGRVKRDRRLAAGLLASCPGGQE